MALAVSLWSAKDYPQTSPFETINVSSFIPCLCIKNLRAAQLGGSDPHGVTAMTLSRAAVTSGPF